MNARSLVLALLIGGLFTSSLEAGEDAKASAPGVQWVKRLDTALSRAHEQEKPVLVFCYAPFSSAARHLKKKIWTHPRVAKVLHQHFVPLILNSDAIDSAQSGDGAMSGFGIRMVPTHLVLDAQGRVLITERGLPASDPAKMVKWIEARARDVVQYGRRTKAVQAKPKQAGPQIELLQLRLELATRLGLVGGHVKVHRPPASAGKRQIDVVIEEARSVAQELDKTKNPGAYRAWSIWAHASLAGEVNRAAALARLDTILDDLARNAQPEGAIVAFNTAYALFEADPLAARSYLVRVIKTWPESEMYWKARVYEAYSYGRAGDSSSARKLYEAIVKDGPPDDSWVKSAKRTLRQLADRERKGR